MEAGKLRNRNRQYQQPATQARFGRTIEESLNLQLQQIIRNARQHYFSLGYTILDSSVLADSHSLNKTRPNIMTDIRTSSAENIVGVRLGNGTEGIIHDGMHKHLFLLCLLLLLLHGRSSGGTLSLVHHPSRQTRLWAAGTWRK